MASSRFKTISKDAMNNLLDNKDSKSTARTVRKGEKLFRDYLLETNGGDGNFELLSKSALNDHLRNYYASIKKKGKGNELDGGMYKVNAYTNLRYGLSKYIKKAMGFDIIGDAEFDSSNDVYRAMCKKLAKEGFGKTNHMTSISDEDLTLLYSGNHHAFDVNTPVGLQQKVWYNIVFYMCRRGRENQHDMTKDWYKVGKDASGREYVFQAVSEADKNHSGSKPMKYDETTGESRMYSLPGNPACPVRSFQKYVSKLNPALEKLWQRPLESFVEDAPCWYYMSPVSANNLAGFMKKISKAAGLSYEYTNHCVRSTHITVLDDNDFSVGQIMRSSGHKSESSIKSYASRLSDKKKRNISDALSNAAGLETKSVPAAALGAPPPVAALPGPPVAASFGPPQGVVPGPLPVATLPPADFLPDAFDLVPLDSDPFSQDELLSIDAIMQDLHSSYTPNTTTLQNTHTLDINSTSDNRSFNFMPNINNCNINFNFFGPAPKM